MNPGDDVPAAFPQTSVLPSDCDWVSRYKSDRASVAVRPQKERRSSFERVPIAGVVVAIPA